MRALLLAVMLSACYPSAWSGQDVLLQTAVVATTAVDWKQSRSYTKTCQEYNTIIGECGEVMGADPYFVTVLALEVLVVWLTPPELRPAVQGTVIGVEGATVWDNTRR